MLWNKTPLIFPSKSINDPSERRRRRKCLTLNSLERKMRSDQRPAVTSDCLRSSDEPAKLSDRTTPGPGTTAPPPGWSGRGNPSNTCNGKTEDRNRTIRICVLKGDFTSKVSSEFTFLYSQVAALTNCNMSKFTVHVYKIFSNSFLPVFLIHTSAMH